MASSNFVDLVTLSSDEEMEMVDGPKMEEAQMEAMGLPVSFKASWVKELQTTKIKTDAKNYWCVICEIQLNSIQTYNSHAVGKDHQKKMKAFRLSRGEAIPPPSAPSKVEVPVRLAQKVVETVEPVVGLCYVTETLAESDPEMEPHYSCSLDNQQGQANCMLLHLQGRAHRQAWVLKKYGNLAEKLDLSQADLKKEANMFDERHNLQAIMKIQVISSDEAYPWPQGRAPWLRENGGSGEVPDAALQNYGDTFVGSPVFQQDTKPVFILPTLESLKPPQSLEEARRLIALGSSLCQAGRHALTKREELSLRAGVAMLEVKFGKDGGRSSFSRGDGEGWVKREPDSWTLGGRRE